MATKQIQLSATGETVAHNLRRIRQLRGMRLEDVATLMSYWKRPMSKATLSQIEKGQRRVDVDDLLVFSRVLKVNPNALLFPPSLPDGISAFEISGFGWQASDRVRDWAEGRSPLDPPEAPRGVEDSDWSSWASVDLHSASLAPSGAEIPHRKAV